jgi:hypothetical protein
MVLPRNVRAGEGGTSTAPAELRASIDRAANQFVSASPLSSTDLRLVEPLKARQMTGGGGKGMLIWTLVGTAASLAATYFVVKEVRKQTEKLNEQ